MWGEDIIIQPHAKTIGDVSHFASAVRPWGITQSTSFPSLKPHALVIT